MTMKAIILVLLLTLPTTPVSSTGFFSRAKALAGESTKTADIITLSSPEVTLFGADVVTDVYTGITLIRGPPNSTNQTGDGRIDRPHPIWGWSMVGIPFIPMVVVGGAAAVEMIGDQRSCCGRLGLTILCILLAAPFAALATPAYIAFVLYVGLRKVVNPDYDYEILGFNDRILRSLEISTESALQTCLGELKGPLTKHLPRSLHPLGSWHQPGPH